MLEERTPAGVARYAQLWGSIDIRLNGLENALGILRKFSPLIFYHLLQVLFLRVYRLMHSPHSSKSQVLFPPRRWARLYQPGKWAANDTGTFIYTFFSPSLLLLTSRLAHSFVRKQALGSSGNRRRSKWINEYQQAWNTKEEEEEERSCITNLAIMRPAVDKRWSPPGHGLTWRLCTCVAVWCPARYYRTFKATGEQQLVRCILERD